MRTAAIETPAPGATPPGGPVPDIFELLGWPGLGR